ncbi:MAG: nucleotidyltransferase family protein, partial [Nitrospirae bacterium]|nr:nucleotidyltransferase family protein [Nitrospirota bacterium]
MKNLFLNLLLPLHLQKAEALNIRREDLQWLKEMAIRHNLLMLLYMQLKGYQNDAGMQDYINEFLAELKPLYLRNAVISLRQETVGHEVVSLLRQRGIPAAVIKGNTLAREIYHDPNSRTTADIDLLIRKADARKADALLLASGFTGDESVPLAYCLFRIHHAAYYEPKKCVIVEMHWHFGVPYFFNLSENEIWEDIITDDSGELRLAPEMLFMMLLIHHHSHSFRELRVLVDIVWAFSEYGAGVDWHKFALVLKKAGLMNTALITLDQIRALWDKIFEKLPCLKSLNEEIGVVGCKKKEALSAYFSLNPEKDYR